jgi:hypothetical protein
MTTVAALFVDERGPYVGLPDVDVWGLTRDARTYAGPYPVVAHPPCSVWCQLAAINEKRYGHKRGEDGGCFAAAVASVRRWGGILEHPAYSLAWPAFGLVEPPSSGTWARDLFGGWVCHVEQGQYGHEARKATWLYAFGVTELPSLRWGRGAASNALVSYCTNHVPDSEQRKRLSKKEARRTPIEFRDVLISIARSVKLG